MFDVFVSSLPKLATKIRYANFKNKTLDI